MALKYKCTERDTYWWSKAWLEMWDRGTGRVDYHGKSVAEESVHLAKNIAENPFAREAGDDDKRIAEQRNRQITKSDGQQ